MQTEQILSVPRGRGAAGKYHSARNGVKHGLFTSELFLAEGEKPECQALRRALYEHFSPASPMQHVAFDRVVCCCWRGKLATRLEMNRLKTHFELENAENSRD